VWRFQSNLFRKNEIEKGNSLGEVYGNVSGGLGLFANIGTDRLTESKLKF